MGRRLKIFNASRSLGGDPLRPVLLQVAVHFLSVMEGTGVPLRGFPLTPPTDPVASHQSTGMDGGVRLDHRDPLSAPMLLINMGVP